MVKTAEPRQAQPFAFEWEHQVLLQSLLGDLQAPSLFDEPVCKIAALNTKSEPQALLCLDEVGRGCLAGPVVTAASLWIPTAQLWPQPWLVGVRDSKKLSPAQRERLFAAAMPFFPNLANAQADLSGEALLPTLQFAHLVHPLRATYPLDPETFDRETQRGPSSRGRASRRSSEPHWFRCLGVTLGSASPEEIDAINIWNAVQLAMARAMTRLFAHTSEQLAATLIPTETGICDSSICTTRRPTPQNCVIVIDGNKGIRVPLGFQNCPQATLIGGDDKLASIGFSSIVAKVARDNFMKAKATEFPVFAFEQHKGYATQVHRDALAKHAPSPLHRRSFLGSFNLPQ